MKYALGNMLNGAGGLNADGLSLDLQFAADKTLTARKGPTPVFTRASTATFIGSDGLIQSAAINAARFDHDPVTLACKGLLIEEQRQNSLSYSEVFANAYWTKSTSSTPANTSLAPNGNSVNTALVANSTVYPSVHKTMSGITSGQSQTLSIFAKPLTTSTLSLELRGAGLTPDATFNLATGTATGIGVITPFANGWYRCSISKVINSTSVLSIIGMGSTASINDSILIWGAQLEAGSFPTSYIPTTTASVVRSADVCSITGSAFTGFYNQPEGTLFVASERISTGSTFGYIFRSSDGTASNRISLGNSGFPHHVEFFISGGFNQNTNTTAFKKMSGAYKLNDANYSVNGSIGIQDDSVTIPTVDRLEFGSGIIIQSARYYRKRLPNAKLQTLTV
jgi:hypothetical protein